MMLRIKDRAEREFCYAPTAEEVITDIARQGAAQLPPAAGELLPDPDQVPRRDPAALRRAARARVLDEGRLLVRRGRGRDARVLPEDVRRLRAHLHAPGPHVPPRRGRHRRDRRQRLARVPGAGRFRRGPDRLLRRLRLRGQHREGRGARARRAARGRDRADAQEPDARHLHLRGRGEALERAAHAHGEGDPALRQPPRAHGAHPRRPHAERDQGRASSHGLKGWRWAERRGDPRRGRRPRRLPRPGRARPRRRSPSSPTARSRRCPTSSAAPTRRTSTCAASTGAATAPSPTSSPTSATSSPAIPSPDGKGTLAHRARHRGGPRVRAGPALLRGDGRHLHRRGRHAKPFEMGCYGIGVTRIVGAAIEQNHDDKGIIWPDPMAPFTVAVIPLGYAQERGGEGRRGDALRGARGGRRRGAARRPRRAPRACCSPTRS